MTWPPPPIPPEEWARRRKLEGSKRVVRALRKEHERQESMTISILDDDGRPDPDRVMVNRMLDRFAREGEPVGPDKAPQLRAIGAELTSRILDLESRVAELEAVPTAGHADDDWQAQ